MVAVVRPVWVQLVAEFVTPELVMLSVWAGPERVLAWPSAWQQALAGCCAGDPDHHSQRHAGQKPVPTVLKRRPQISQSASDSAHSTILNSSTAQGWGNSVAVKYSRH